MTDDLNDLRKLAAMTSLNKLMKQRHFDICTIRDVGDLLGIPVRNTEEYKILETLHCVDYSEMPPQLRDAIPRMVKKILDLPAVYQFNGTDFTPEVVELPLNERSWCKNVSRRNKPTARQGFVEMLGL